MRERPWPKAAMPSETIQIGQIKEQKLVKDYPVSSVGKNNKMDTYDT